VDSKPSNTFPVLIRDIAVEHRQAHLPRVHLQDLARQRIDAPHEILEWATRDRRWSFTLAELMTEPVSEPRELAAMLVAAIVDELEQERELFAADRLETSTHAVAEAIAQ
jgi:hypothetical protein